jgi:hypothetical protein
MSPVTRDVLLPGEDQPVRRRILTTGMSVHSRETVWVEEDQAGWRLLALDRMDGVTMCLCPVPRKRRRKVVPSATGGSSGSGAEWQ